MEALQLYLTAPTVLIEGFSVTSVAAIVVVCMLILAFFTIKLPGLHVKVMTIMLIPVATAALAGAMIEQLSHPKELSEVWLESRGENGLAIHKAIINPPNRIHIWLDIEGEPRAFFVSWSKELEKSLQKAMEESRDGRRGQLRFRFEPSLEERMQFYAIPWPAPIPKDVEPPTSEPYRFEQEV